jgi:hypothetical protein
MDHVARAVGRPPAAVRELNLYKEGEKTHFGQVLEGCQVRPVPLSSMCKLQLHFFLPYHWSAPMRQWRSCRLTDKLECCRGRACVLCSAVHASDSIGPATFHVADARAPDSDSFSSATQVETCWSRAITSAGGVEQRYAAAAAFNKSSRFRKRGIAVTPTKFGISFTTKFLNQVRPINSLLTHCFVIYNPAVWTSLL